MKKFFLFCLMAMTVFLACAQYAPTPPSIIGLFPPTTNWNAFYITNSLTNINGVYVQNPTNAFEFDYQGTNGIVGSLVAIGLVVSNNATTGYTVSMLTILSNGGGGVSFPCTNWPGTNKQPTFGIGPTNGNGFTLAPPITGFATFGAMTGQGWVTNTVTSNSVYVSSLPTPHPQ